MTVYEFMVEGGPIMVPILGLSVIALGLSLERAVYWLRLWLARDDRLRTELRCVHLDEERVRRTADPVCRVLATYVRTPDDSFAAVAAAERLLDETQTGFSVLHFAATTSTALGLFGTVVGVSISFKAMATSSSREVMYGLAVALNTTVLGLIVFLFTTFSVTFLQSATARLRREIEDGLNEIRIRSQEKRARVEV